MINIEREAIAHHESGHTILYHLLGLRLDSVTIERDSEGHPGSTEFMTRESVKRGWRHEAECIATCGGCIAEARFTGQPARGFAGDEPMLAELLRQVSPSPVVRAAYADYCRAQAEYLLAENWPLVEAVAEALLERRTLDRDGIEAAIRQGRRRFRARQARSAASSYRIG